MTAPANASAHIVGRFSTALFPIALGLAGLGSAYLAAAPSFGLDLIRSAGKAFLAGAMIVLILDTCLYIAKYFSARCAFTTELSTATSANLLAPAFMAAMVLGANLTVYHSAGRLIWATALILHLILLLRFAGRWIVHAQQSEDLNPTWFLPAAGLMTGAMTWDPELAVSYGWFVFAAGASLWIMLLPLIFRRLVFEPALPPRLRPTLFIVAAPFGLAANSILTLAPQAAPAIAGTLGFAGSFFILILLCQPRFLRQAGISLSWWATTFPVATVAVGLLRLADLHAWPIEWFALGLGALATLFTLIALFATCSLAWRTCFGKLEIARTEIAAMQGMELEIVRSETIRTTRAGSTPIP